MNGNFSLLSRVSLSDVKSDPFPHIVIKNAIPEELADELIRQYPPLNVLTKGKVFGSNKRFNYSIKDIHESGGVPDIWREFIEAQTSHEFVQRFFSLFGEHIEKTFPDFSRSMKPWESIKKGIRDIDSYEEKNMLLGASISGNTSVTKKPDSVRGVHVDDPRKIYSGLFYLRPPEDADSRGGDLLFYKYKTDKYKMFGQHVFPKYVEKVATVPYEKNTFVFFLNTTNSLHGVSVRERTPHARYFVNLIGEVQDPLFDIQSHQEALMIRRMRVVKNKITAFFRGNQESY
jgi:hypothetical protein